MSGSPAGPGRPANQGLPRLTDHWCLRRTLPASHGRTPCRAGGNMTTIVTKQRPSASPAARLVSPTSPGTSAVTSSQRTGTKPAHMWPARRGASAAPSAPGNEVDLVAAAVTRANAVICSHGGEGRGNSPHETAYYKPLTEYAHISGTRITARHHAARMARTSGRSARRKALPGGRRRARHTLSRRLNAYRKPASRHSWNPLRS